MNNLTNLEFSFTLHKWYFVTKIVLTYCEKGVLVIEKTILRSLEQFIQIVKGHNNLVTEHFFNLSLEVSQI